MEHPAPDYNPHMARVAGISAIIMVAVLIVAKGWMYLHGGSASMLASFMDSVADASTALMSFMAIHYSLKPADKNHRSGHGKIEGLAALFQSFLILASGIFVLVEATRRFIEPVEISGYLESIGVMVFAIVSSLTLVAIQSHTLKKAPSLAVEADRANYSMDVLVNMGVIMVMVGLYYGAPLWVDPFFAILVALYLGYTAMKVGKKAVDMLLDRELSKDIRQKIKEIVLSQDGVMGMHDLRTNQSGMRLFFSFDIEADPDLSLRDAHEIARRVETKLFEQFPNADILIHMDPHGDTDDTRHLVEEVHK